MVIRLCGERQRQKYNTRPLFRQIFATVSQLSKSSIFCHLYMINNSVNGETLLARVWGWGKTFPSSPDAGKQRLSIHVRGVKAVFSGYPNISGRLMFQGMAFVAYFISATLLSS